jgi:Asp-tRNA(Asn)/Glu-tRNA(Gln) amidotransferase A subunit family amidase
VAYGFMALDPAGTDPVGFITRAAARGLAGVRLGVGDPFLWRDCDAGIVETLEEAVKALVQAGAVAREFTLPEAETGYAVFLEGGLSAIELRSFLDRELPDWLDHLDPVIAPAVRNADGRTAWRRASRPDSGRPARRRCTGFRDGWLVNEVLSRPMRDRRAVARYAGLTGAPDESGAKRREQGLAKAGNARVRRGMIQLAWRFLRFQKNSALALAADLRDRVAAARLTEPRCVPPKMGRVPP